jgi:UDP-N-acetylmuramoylalanine--D-glutamate ligase
MMVGVLDDACGTGRGTAGDGVLTGTNVAGRHVLVVGMARSGVAAARLLLRHGARVSAADARPLEALGDEARRLTAEGVTLHAGESRMALLDGVDAVVISPGVPRTVPLLAEAARRGIAILGELELAARFSRAPIVAVTGTNGKSTTVTWIGHLLSAAGRANVVAGNVGTALAGVVESVPEGGVLVVEVSSFQLETTAEFRPAVGVALNLAPDHLDRYASVADYYATKERLYLAQEATDVAVLNAEDPELMGWAPRLRARLVTFGGPAGTGEGTRLLDGTLVLETAAGVTPILAASRLGIPGPHNVRNALASLAALHGLGVDVTDPAVARGLEDFRGLEHRIEFAGELNGVRFYNDSKATNTDSLAVALASFAQPVVLIAGGRDKKGDFPALAPLVSERVALVVTIGEAAATIRKAWGHAVNDWVSAGTSFERAVEAAYQEALARGGVVLLSPGCASFDMFRDYEDRGRRFKALVAGLGAERIGA